MNLKKFRQFSIIVFVVGFLALAVSFYATQKSQSIGQDVKITYRRQQTIFKNGSPSLQQTSKVVRLRKADGSWKESITDYDENDLETRTRVQYAINGRGLFLVSEKNKKLFLVAERPGPPVAFPADAMKQKSNFVKEDSLLGYKTLVMRDESDDVNYMEYHYATELNGLLLKSIDASAESMNVQEAVEIKVETISPEEFGELPDYPIEKAY